MSTHRTTTTIVKDVRSWLDFDQKFLAAFVTLICDAICAGVELGQHSITWGVAGLQVGPVAIAAALAYIATSQHREVIDHTVTEADRVADEAAPFVEAAVPVIAPEVKAVVTSLDTLAQQLPAEPVEDFTAPVK